MNNRIFEIIQDLDGRVGLQWTEADKEELAELIVKRCIQLIDEENARLCEYQNSLPEWDGNRRDDCDLVIEKCIDLAETIKKHFGVEE